MEKEAARCDIKGNIKYMKPSSSQGTGAYKESMVEMKLEGVTLKQLVGYLYHIESPEDAISIKRVSRKENKKNISPEEVAVIKSNYLDWGDLHVVVTIQEIDGNLGRPEVPHLPIGPPTGSVHVLPGMHSVIFRATYYHAWLIQDVTFCTLVLQAEAGHTYKPHGRNIRNDMWVWIVDVNTGLVAADLVKCVRN